MKKIVSNILIVSMQLLVGGLFLLVLFLGKSSENNSNMVVRNNNLDKMADSVAVLFIDDLIASSENTDDSLVEELVSQEEKEEQERIAREKAEAEAKALEEEKKRLEEEQKQKEEEAKRNAVIVSASGYISKPGLGFNVTTGNKTYTLNDSDFNLVAGVVACEANKSSKDDILAVISVILNRADRRGISPAEVVSQSGQFSCYYHPGDPSLVANVVTDAVANGIRNNSYNSFNGWYSDVSNNYIVDYGNRYYS